MSSHVTGVFSGVHQPASVGLLLCSGRPVSVAHYEVRMCTHPFMTFLLTLPSALVLSYSYVLLFKIILTRHFFHSKLITIKMSCADVSLSPLSLSPLVSRIFPASFPNKQYQLLFTQGSGESKEGGTRPHHCVFFFFLHHHCASGIPEQNL